VVIKNGTPSEEIIGVAEDNQADLLVIASKGRSNLPDFLFGTTTEKIFRHSTVPVLRVGLKNDHSQQRRMPG
jgi:nucleotide-binding universal stress UspA family protein